MDTARDIERLTSRLEKLFFLNTLFVATGQESVEAMYILEDEIALLQDAYNNVSDKLEALI